MLLLDAIIKNNTPEAILALYIFSGILFIAIFLCLTRSDLMGNGYMGNFWYQVIFLILIILVLQSDTYIALLLFLLYIIQFVVVCRHLEPFQVTTEPPAIFGVLDKTPPDIFKSDVLAEDDIFKMDPVKKTEILRAVRAQLDFDPFKSDLTRQTILDIYRKYFGEEEALKYHQDYETYKSYEP